MSCKKAPLYGDTYFIETLGGFTMQVDKKKMIILNLKELGFKGWRLVNVYYQTAESGQMQKYYITLDDFFNRVVELGFLCNAGGLPYYTFMVTPSMKNPPPKSFYLNPEKLAIMRVTLKKGDLL